MLELRETLGEDPCLLLGEISGLWNRAGEVTGGVGGGGRPRGVGEAP